jgi:hypothetical protein
MNGAFGTLDEADEVLAHNAFVLKRSPAFPLGYRFALVGCLTIWAARRCWNRCLSEQSRRSPTHRAISRSLADWLFSGWEMDRWFMHCLYEAFVDVSHLRRTED